MKHFTITVTGTIDAPGETNADIAQGIKERVAAVAVQGGKLVTEIASITRLAKASLVVEGHGGAHLPAEVISLAEVAAGVTSPRPSPQSGEGETTDAPASGGTSTDGK